MNAGIGHREVKDVVCELEVMSPTGGQIRHLGRQLLRFSYRALRGLAPGSVILLKLTTASVCIPIPPAEFCMWKAN